MNDQKRKFASNTYRVITPPRHVFHAPYGIAVIFEYKKNKELFTADDNVYYKKTKWYLKYQSRHDRFVENMTEQRKHEYRSICGHMLKSQQYLQLGNTLKTHTHIEKTPNAYRNWKKEGFSYAAFSSNNHK